MRVISKTLAVGDIEVACTLVGEGVPVVVLHGAIGLGSTYMRPLDPWGEDFQLVYYDQRGSGHTPLGDVRRVSFAGGVEDLEGVREALGLDRIALVGHSAGAHLAALYAGLHPATTSSLVLLNAGPPLVPEQMLRFGGAMTARRTPEDDDARRAIEESDGFRTGQPAALEAHQLNTFLPFFRDRATAARVSLGFTEITAANVQAAPERMIGSLGALDPMGTYADHRVPLAGRPLGRRSHPGRVEPPAGRHHSRRRLLLHRGRQPLLPHRGPGATQRVRRPLAPQAHHVTRRPAWLSSCHGEEDDRHLRRGRGLRPRSRHPRTRCPRPAARGDRGDSHAPHADPPGAGRVPRAARRADRGAPVHRGRHVHRLLVHCHRARAPRGRPAHLLRRF